ncbi:MAG: TrkH family potassium uptake protein [Candidatus Delongbacteria bacterium]|nr:TrkH family potassium uptake protein [Candidatus Delongbacteria bacterium]
MKNIVNVFLSQLFQNPFLLLLSSFVFLITVGTLLLILPYSSANNISISFIDSLFTSTSAVCVTGLVVMDTYTSFSIFGQIVIISLIQMGGLGIIIIMTFGSLIIGQRIGIRHEYIVSEMLGSKKIKFAYEIIKFIVITTFLFELTGAIALFYSFYSYENSIIIAIWKSIFHSISAFCNAGFALQSSSLIRYNNSPSILIVIMALIVSGGIGFPVLIYIKKILKKEISFSNVPVFVKISMLVTLSLILIGFFGLLLSEYQYSLKHLSFIDKLSNALFLSITPRTAGFNSTNMTDLSSSSIILIMFLMFIGGGSGSTAGGIKVTTFGVLIGVFISFIKGRKGVVLFNREISSLIVNRSVILLSFSIFLIIISTYILLINQNLNLTESLFEVVSAYGTVGLSLGTTAKLNSFGKFIIILLMYCGRVGLLSIFLLFIKEKKSNIRYTVENISVG